MARRKKNRRGRRSRFNPQLPAPTHPHPGPADWLQYTRVELVEMARNGDEGAAAELQHRGRDPMTGQKVAGIASQFSKPVGSKAAANPWHWRR